MNFDQLFFDLVDLDLGEIIENEPMYKHTTFKVGGPARFFIYIKDIDALKRGVQYCRQNQVKHMTIGKGSDILFSDKEYDGVVFSLSRGLNKVYFNGLNIRAEAGVSMIYLAYEAAKVGLSGFEFMGGIPGTIGGGVYMNAGAYKYCMADVFTSAMVLNEHGEIMTLSKEDMAFDYRKSILQKHKDWILIEATFTMTSRDPQEIMKVLDKRKEKRMSTQPWNFASAGSIFRNPDEKPAWQYIDECNLRGYEIGGAQVSPKHSNFIVNNGYASARDILELILLVEKTVFDRFRVELKKEVILVNWE
ncbi:UDP-N-acetylmuramate dehydrogenase [Candidatus Stoquefichus massiliensis]|uniref:UDP-N-acetylmuramate dehydrogenase n=1 Tax=Candidatus Stoquefichus massiliensis TaxID=1470350 RepID=UPI0004805487|nr:UDP-N-acetylmuramate dehydrogenase [Candidatus Stoquefichus massiliensis]